MTMPTNSLPFQITGANALSGANALGTKSSSPEKSGASANGGFGATLSREIAQRQPQPQQQAMPAPSAAQGPKPQQQQSKPNAADKPASREPAHQAAAKPAQAAQEGNAETRAAQAGDKAEEPGAAEAAAAAGSPAADMLAFMASLAQPAAAPVAGEAVDAALAGGQQALTALENALENMKGAMGGAAAGDSGAGQDLAAGVQLPSTDTKAVAQDAAALLQDKGQQDAAGFQAQLRDAQKAVPAAAEETAPPLAQLQAQAAKLAEVQNPAAAADRIPARLGSQAWDNQVSQRIVYMVGKEQAATLTLNPPDLGPVQVVLNVSNDQASVAFSSQQLEVRQALENALPRLREMMSESGIALGNATVDAGSANQQGAQDSERRAQGNGGGNGGSGGNGGNGLAGGSEPALNEVAPRPTRTVAIGDRGMVDLFA